MRRDGRVKKGSYWMRGRLLLGLQMMHELPRGVKWTPQKVAGLQSPF